MYVCMYAYVCIYMHAWMHIYVYTYGVYRLCMYKSKASLRLGHPIHRGCLLSRIAVPSLTLSCSMAESSFWMLFACYMLLSMILCCKSTYCLYF